MSENTAKKPRFTWRERNGRSAQRKTEALDLAPVELGEGEVDAVSALGCGTGGIEDLANGPLAPIGRENGEVTERGLRRVRSAVKFLAELLGGRKHRDAMAASGLTWAQVNSFALVCPEFERMYQTAKGGMKQAMGAVVLDTAFEMATEGEPVYDRKTGEKVGVKKSEKMLDRLLTLSGREFRKEPGNSKTSLEGGGITLNFHFDGKGKPAEVVDVR